MLGAQKTAGERTGGHAFAGSADVIAPLLDRYYLIAIPVAPVNAGVAAVHADNAPVVASTEH
jgi:hypothetical protein